MHCVHRWAILRSSNPPELMVAQTNCPANKLLTNCPELTNCPVKSLLSCPGNVASLTSQPSASQRMLSPYAHSKLFTVFLGVNVLVMAAFEIKLLLKLSNCNHGPFA